MPEPDEPKGLTGQEAGILQKKYGKNELKREQGKLLQLFISNFFGPLSLLLIIVVLVTYALGDSTSSFIILALVGLNGLLGFYQEYKSEQAGEKLRKQILFLCNVRRDGAWQNIAVSELVPGDVVRITLGDRVPADLRLYSAHGLLVDEAILTGESYPARKTASAGENTQGMAFMGTIVADGFGEGVVARTGNGALLGKTASLLALAQEPSTFEKSIAQISRQIVRLIIVSVFLIFLVNALLGKSLIASLLFAIALAVGLIPEALQVIITITLSNGALALSRHGVIVKRLSAIEDLGNVDILCTDKTGTLTENNMVVQGMFDISGNPRPDVLEYAARCVQGTASTNPIDEAIRLKLKSDKVLAKKLLHSRPLALVEFDYERRRMSALVGEMNGDDRLQMITKGSPESVIAICAMTGAQRKAALETYRKMGESGYRTIAVAVKSVRQRKIAKTDETGMQLVGFLTLFDPPKKSVREVLDLAQRLGISIKLMSGDGPIIAKHIARAVGFEFQDSQVMTGAELDELWATTRKGGKGARVANEEEIKSRIQGTVIFARVSPTQKYLLTKKLREYGHSVAFLGDGINDAPAIKEADVGISVNNGSDVTKEAADIILVRKSINAVVQGIIGGRKVFTNVVKYMTNTLAGNFGDLYTIGIASAFIPFIPLTPVQLLLSNFLTDAPMVSISTDNVEDEELIKPKRWDIGGLVRVGAIFGLVSTVFDLLVIVYFLNSGEAFFRTALYLEVILSEIIVIISLRSYKPFYQAEPPSRAMLLALVLSVLAGVALVYSPYATLFGFAALPTTGLLVLLGIILAYFMATELVKQEYTRMFLQAGVVDGHTLKMVRKRIIPELR